MKHYLELEAIDEKSFVLLVILVGIVSMASCQLEINFDELYGSTWMFSDGSTLYVTPEDNSFPTNLGFDIRFTANDIEYFCYGDGTHVGNTVHGEYAYTHDDVFGADEIEITIKFELSRNNKLTITLTGEGPLNGRVFSGGVRQSQ
ncbi:MAG: hypothetical protein WDA14_07475 [Sphaerochaetaceae bacterium]|nr:hypothetical protein [Sphaerochaetaceae bacterium]